MLLAFDLQRIGVGSKINGAPRTPNLAADRTNTQLRLGGNVSDHNVSWVGLF